MFSSSEAMETMTRACFKGDKRVQRRTQKVYSHREMQRSVNKGIFLFKNFFISLALLSLLLFGCTAPLVGSSFVDKGRNPCPRVVESQSPNHRTAREVPRGTFFKA